MTPQLFDEHNLSTLSWPASEDGDYARRYLSPFMQHGPRTYIRNAYTTLQLLRVGDTLLPITLNAYHADNSYVCSPYTHYVSYAQEEFVNLKNPPVERLLRALFLPLAWYFRRSQLDNVLYVNNWLLSTNLYPVMTPDEITAALMFLVKRYPERAIVFRSVDNYHNPTLYKTLLQAGCRMIFSRQVYYQDVQSRYVQKKKQYRIDLKHFQRTPYTVVEGAQLRDNDSIERILELYNDLYLRKYSYYNPQFTPAFIRLALDEQLLTLKAFQKEGRIDAVMGYFARRGTITPPLFGYDTSLPQKLGLYRLLSTLTALDALANKQLVHFSAGVGQFKRHRGGLPALEHNAVYDAHLPATRRRPWSLLKSIMDKIAVPIIEKYGF